jgi:hypothetical protein
MSEQSGDDVDGGVAVEVFGSEHASAVVWGQVEGSAVGVGCSGGYRQRAKPVTDGH